MEVRVYEIEKSAVSKVKNILEATDKTDVEIKCQECGKTEVKTIDVGRTCSDMCSCGGPTKIISDKISYLNKFGRNGYNLVGAKSIDVDKESSFLYVKADKEFFENNESLIMIDGVKKLEGSGMEEIQKKIEEQEDKAAAGFGGIFG